jgi:hypothetical protein
MQLTSTWTRWFKSVRTNPYEMFFTKNRLARRVKRTRVSAQVAARMHYLGALFA